MTDNALYEDFKSKILQLRPVIALLSFKGWKDEGKPSADKWLLSSRGVDWKTAMTYPNARGWDAPIIVEDDGAPVVKRGRGRPKGSKNKPKRPEYPRRGRPKGSKNSTK